MIETTDLVSNERGKQVEATPRDIKKNARIIHALKGDVPLPLWMSVGLFEIDCIANTADLAHSHHDHSHHDHSQADHLDIDSYTFLSFSSDGSFALRKFQNFLYKQLRESVFRAKGILWFKESEKHHVFHLANKRFCIDNSDWEGDRRNKLVLICQDMDQDVLRKQLQNCDFKDSDPRIQ